MRGWNISMSIRDVSRLCVLWPFRDSEEAARAYQAFLKTDYSKTGPGHINATDYLVAAHRYREAAENYRYLDKTLSDWGMEPSLDNIQLYMLPKYRANAEAGRGDSARVVAQRILALLDSAITNQKNSATAELATIYDTQGKEAQIAHQEADLLQQRLRCGNDVGLRVLLCLYFPQA